jgi:phosphosulfolactate synthase
VDDTRLHTQDYLASIGVYDRPARTSPFDPGYDPLTLESHLEQSAQLIALLKISMACWLIANEAAIRRKVKAAVRWGVPTVTGGGPFEIAAALGRLPEYLALCADIGFTCVECGEGFTELHDDPATIVGLVRSFGLEAQFELGKKHGGAFTDAAMSQLVARGMEWLEAGASRLAIEARESARGVGLFDDAGQLDRSFADRFADAFGLDVVVFEAPNKPSQFALLDHFGADVQLCNVRLEELLRVEIYRRGLHSDAFGNDRLRPVPPLAEWAG